MLTPLPELEAAKLGRPRPKRVRNYPETLNVRPIDPDIRERIILGAHERRWNSGRMIAALVHVYEEIRAYASAGDQEAAAILERAGLIPAQEG